MTGLADDDTAKAKLYDPKRMLVRSGVAHDAKESMIGIVSIEEPKSFFKPEARQMTWWGEFKPFRYWGTPTFKAKWFSPGSGETPVSEQDFTAGHCVLAKSTLIMEGDGPLERGRWRVDVYSGDQKIDSRDFMIFSPDAPPAKPVERPRVRISSEVRD